MRSISSIAAVAALATLAMGHVKEDPATYLARQETAYHCYPAIRDMVNKRKRSFTQKVLSAGAAAIPGADPTSTENLFIDESAHSVDTKSGPQLSCTSAEEAKIRNHTCVLAPSVTQGPYYHNVGHPIRQNMAEHELGNLFLIDIGVIDVETCKPVEGILVDIWHANATGHYSGHEDPAPHLVNETPAKDGIRKGLLSAYPRWNHVQTWLRAAWPTNSNGVSQFTSIVPGYYTGRATHVHMRAHSKWSTLANGTFTSSQLIYTGQFFFDDTFNMFLDKSYPYSLNPIRNKWGRTRNWDDSLGIYQESHKNGFQPTFDMHPLGGVFLNGWIGYITVGVNMSASLQPDLWSPEGKVY